MEKMYFREEQRFWNVWWVRLLLAAIVLISGYGIYGEAGVSGLLAGESISGISGLALVILLFYIMKLEVSFDEHGINYSFFPFHLKQYHISWSQIDTIYIRHYSPLGEYGGWGIRFGLFGSGTAYNISGNIGLQIISGKRKILFGTKQPQSMEAALQALFRVCVIKGSQLTDGGIVLVH